MSKSARILLALSQLPRVGPAKIGRILARAQSTGIAVPSLEDAVAWLEMRVPNAPIGVAVAAADRILEQCQSQEIAVHVYGSSSYPSQLNRLSKPPAILFALGEFEPERMPRIAVVGTRKPTGWGTRTAKECTRHIAATDVVVVSGLALGIDTAAHETTISAGGTNVGGPPAWCACAACDASTAKAWQTDP